MLIYCRTKSVAQNM